MQLLKNKKFILALLLALGIAIAFWTGSRYPQLNEKALMGESTPVFGIGFDNWLPVPEDANAVEQIMYNTLNWAYTNKKGMFFGLLFASSIMLLFHQLAQYFSNNRMSNTFLGMFIGAPLGVCVNCAAPIAQGVRSSGGRAETALAMLFSSPSLNFVILTMLFSMFPMYMVVLKLSFTILVIVVFIPLITRFLFKDDVVLANPDGIEGSISTAFLPSGLNITEDDSDSWLASIKWMVGNFFRCLWHILKTTLPLMLLAGFLGNVFITFFPFESIMGFVPEYGWVRITGFMLVLGLVGTFLPVPIAFDVIISAILLVTGMPVQYVLVLLLSLGIYSVYAFFIVRQSVSFKVAMALFFCIAIGATIFAGIGWKYESHVKQKKKKLYAERLIKPAETPLKTFGPAPVNYPIPDQSFVERLLTSKARYESIFTQENESLEILKKPFASKGNGQGLSFERKEGVAWGINESPSLTLNNFYEPMGYGPSISSGDVHNDGWTDLLLTSNYSISLYANIDGEKFSKQLLDTSLFAHRYIFAAALVDFNNDGWLDIYYTTLKEGNHIIYNNQGVFDSVQEVPNLPNVVMSMANSFGDVDKDGLLDILIGNMDTGLDFAGKYSSPNARNAVALQRKDSIGRFTLLPLSGKAGETLTVLITDFNDDGNADLLCGNDFSIPDNYYVGDGTGKFKQLTIADSIVSVSSKLTMSISTADINNDLRTDMYFAGGSNLYLDSEERTDADEQLCSEIKDEAERSRCIEKMKIHRKMTLAKLKGDVFSCPPEYFEECLVLDLFTQYSRAPIAKKDEYREHLRSGWDTYSLFSAIEFEKDSVAYSESSWAMEIPQIQAENVLHIGTDQGRYVEKAREMGLYQAGWSWNCKFADIDNDEWQDMYAVNGSFHEIRRDDKFLFKNDAGNGFTDVAKQAGLESFFATYAYTYVDFDNDGDLDIISVPTQAPVIVFENKSDVGNAVAFEIEDSVGNWFGIGTRITIHYGENMSKHQMREIQSGGGFKSFDAAKAWFGLGSHDSVSKVEVRWSTGETSVIEMPLEVNATYRIRRGKNQILQLNNVIGQVN